ncbi:MAG: discoidin domain-containing protein, partial [Victivallaceae bacterium]
MIKKLLTIAISLWISCLASGQTKMLKMDFHGDLKISGLEREATAAGSGPVRFASGSGVVVGADNSLKIPHYGRLNPEEGMLEMRIRPLDWDGAAKEFQFFFHCRNREDGSIVMLQKDPDGNVAFLIGFLKKFAKVSIPATDWKPGGRYMLKAVWTRDRLELYQDGKLRASAPRHYEKLNLDGNIHVGGKIFAPCRGESAIDFFRLHSGIPTVADEAVMSEPAQKQSAAGQPRNIASSKFQAVMLPSSQWQPDSSLAIEQAMDGNLDSYYLSGKDDGVHWIEIRWPQPVIADGVQAVFRAPFSSGGYHVRYSVDGDWREILNVTDNLGELHPFSPITADKIRVYFDNAPNGQLGLRELQVTGSAPHHFLQSPGWTGFFIWYPEPTVNDVVRYFRKSFQIEPGVAIGKAMLQICADDAFTVYVNGRQIGTGGFRPELYDVTSLLESGRNSIAILAREFSICEGVLAELTLIDSRGEVKRISTDSTWLAAKEPIPGWTEPGFDDSKWLNAIRSVNLGNYTANIKYRYFGSSGTGFELRQLTPNLSVRPGEAFELRAALTCRKTIGQDYGFRAVIGEEALGNASDYTVLTADIKTDLPTSQWEPGKSYEVVWKMRMPNWAPHGKMPIRFQALSSSSEIVVSAPPQNIEIVRFDNPPPRRHKPVRAAIVGHDGQLRMEVDGKIMPPVIFALNASYNNTFRELGEHSSIQTGVYRYSLLDSELYPPKGADPEKFFRRLMDIIDQDINNMLRLYPNAYILFSPSFRPGTGWSEEWPDETVQMSDGFRIKHSFSSDVWLQMSNDAATRIVAHLRQSDYAGHIAGINFSIGEGAEAMHWGHRTNTFNTPREKVVAGDFSPAARNKFRIYLRHLYKNDVNALRTAWQNPQMDFESAKVDIEELRREDQQNFRDPARGAMAMDYWNFHSDSVAESAVRLAENIKTACNGEWLVGLWGFYNLAQLQLIHSPASSHMVAYAGIDKVLNSPSIDYLAGIQSYAGVNAGTPVIT